MRIKKNDKLIVEKIKPFYIQKNDLMIKRYEIELKNERTKKIETWIFNGQDVK